VPRAAGVARGSRGDLRHPRRRRSRVGRVIRRRGGRALAASRPRRPLKRAPRSSVGGAPPGDVVHSAHVDTASCEAPLTRGARPLRSGPPHVRPRSHDHPITHVSAASCEATLTRGHPATQVRAASCEVTLT
jgi:hypothetical protein